MKFIAVAAFFFSAINAFGWGQTGHRVIGEIAENHLSRKAKKNIEKLLGDESLAIVSTWMDEIRSDEAYDHTHPWHYTTIPPGETYETAEVEDGGRLVKAIEDMIGTLKNEEKPKEEKVEALKMLVHLVGDLHQPLHVGTGEDRGGNDVKLEFFYQPSNLHRIWDSGMIDHKQLSYTELAEAVDHASKDQVQKWTKGTVADWADEAVQYREQVYAIGDKDYLSYEYVYKNWDLVQQQLQKAGVRLAGVLNAIYG